MNIEIHLNIDILLVTCYQRGAVLPAVCSLHVSVLISLRMPGLVENRDNEVSVPLPVSLTLYNLFLPNKKDSKKALLRPKYTADLLVPVRLDILFASREDEKESKNAAFEEELDDQIQDDILMFSSVNDRGALHPSWDHLDERVDVFNETGNTDFHSLYQSMRLRVIATLDADRILVDQPLHPSRLRRLPEDTSNPEDGGGIAWGQRPPPKKLPPNAVLIDYSDGSTRVCPPLYHLLVEKNVIVEPDPGDASLLQDENEEHRRQSRFTDDVFQTLDKVMWSEPPRRLLPSPSSLLETDDETKAVPVKSLGDDDFMTEDYATTLALSGGMNGVFDDDMEKELTKLSLADQDTFLPIELDSAITDLQLEKQKLEQLIANEESCLQQELDMLHKVCLICLLGRT